VKLDTTNITLWVLLCLPAAVAAMLGWWLFVGVWLLLWACWPALAAVGGEIRRLRGRR
jgi:hypothetical protein